MSTLISALRQAVNKYHGGRNALRVALLWTKTDDVFRKELEAGPHHKLGAQDALEAAVQCCIAKTPHCYDYASHVAQECGGKFVLVDDDQAATQSPIEKISCLVRETSDVTTTVLDSMSDGVISDNELAVIEREVAQAQDVLRKLLQASRAVNAKGKPGAGRSIVDLPVINQAAA